MISLHCESLCDAANQNSGFLSNLESTAADITANNKPMRMIRVIGMLRIMKAMIIRTISTIVSAFYAMNVNLRASTCACVAIAQMPRPHQQIVASRYMTTATAMTARRLFACEKVNVREVMPTLQKGAL